MKVIMSNKQKNSGLLSRKLSKDVCLSALSKDDYNILEIFKWGLYKSKQVKRVSCCKEHNRNSFL